MVVIVYVKRQIDKWLETVQKLSSDCNGTRTHNHLARKQTLNHLAKLLKCLARFEQ